MPFNPTFVNQIVNSATPEIGAGSNVYLLARVTHVVRGPYLLNTNTKEIGRAHV